MELNITMIKKQQQDKPRQEKAQRLMFYGKIFERLSYSKQEVEKVEDKRWRQLDETEEGSKRTSKRKENRLNQTKTEKHKREDCDRVEMGAIRKKQCKKVDERRRKIRK